MHLREQPRELSFTSPWFLSRQGPGNMAQPIFPTYSLYSPQQLLWLQHIYARQYYMQ